MSAVIRSHCLRTYQTHVEATNQGALYHPSDDSNRERLLHSLDANHAFLKQELLHVRSAVRLHVLLSARDKHGDGYANAIYLRAKAGARHKPESVIPLLSNMVIPMAARADMASMQPTSVALVFRDAKRFAIPLSQLEASAAPAAAASAPAPAPVMAAPAPDVKPIIFSAPAPAPVLAAPAPAPAPDVKPIIRSSPLPEPASPAPAMAEASGNEDMPIPTLPPMSSNSRFGQSLPDDILMPPTVPASAQPADADSATDSDDDEQFADGDEFQHSMIPETATGASAAASAAAAAASPTDVDAQRETLSQNATISKILASAKATETKKINEAAVADAGEKTLISFSHRMKSEHAGSPDEFISSKLVEALNESRTQAVKAYDEEKAEVERIAVYKVQLAKQLDQQWEAGRISYRPSSSQAMKDAHAQHSASKKALANASFARRQISHASKLAAANHKAKYGQAAKRAQKVQEVTQATVVAMMPQSQYTPFSPGTNNIARLLEIARPMVNARYTAASSSSSSSSAAAAASSIDDSRLKKSRASNADNAQAAKRSKPALPEQFEHNALSMHLPVRHGNFSNMSRASYPTALPVMPVMSMAALQQPRGPPPPAAAAASSSSSSSFVPPTKQQLIEKIALLDNQIATVNTMLSHVGPDEHFQRQLGSLLTTKMSYLDMLSQHG